MFAAITNNQDVAWALAIVACVGALVVVIQSRLSAWLAIVVAIGFLGLVLFWWP
jgi:hypothetical protein